MSSFPMSGALHRGVAPIRARARASFVRALLGATLLLPLPAVLPAELHAQTSGMDLMMTGPLGLPMSRTGSGTSWLPDSAPMFGFMRSAGSWGLMAHGSVFVQGNAQGGPRGDSQFGSLNWAMAGATHGLAGGRLQLRGMVSVDAFTVGGKGYPLLLQTGEAYRGEALHDRQHPHDVFMEIAAVYDRAINDDVAFQLYVAPVGEPVIGPVAFPHRPSAAGDPFATISHHWQDATHISFGVATAGLYTRRVKVEASLFNGREPDDVRTNLDYRRAALDAVAARVTFNPDARTSLSASVGNMPDAEVAHPGEALRRVTASALHTRPRANGGSMSLALVAGANSVGGDTWTPGITAEALRDFGGRHTLFARAEVVRKSGEELVLPEDGDHGSGSAAHGGEAHGGEAAHDQLYALTAFTLGGVRELVRGRAGMIGIGVRGSLNVVPGALREIYGSRTPVGGALFLRWRPSRMSVAPMGNMPGMKHDAHAGHEGGTGNGAR